MLTRNDTRRSTSRERSDDAQRPARFPSRRVWSEDAPKPAGQTLDDPAHAERCVAFRSRSASITLDELSELLSTPLIGYRTHGWVHRDGKTEYRGFVLDSPRVVLSSAIESTRPCLPCGALVSHWRALLRMLVARHGKAPNALSFQNADDALTHERSHSSPFPDGAIVFFFAADRFYDLAEDTHRVIISDLIRAVIVASHYLRCHRLIKQVVVDLLATGAPCSE